MAVDHETLLGWLTRLQLTAIRDQLDNLLPAEKKLVAGGAARRAGGLAQGPPHR